MTHALLHGWGRTAPSVAAVEAVGDLDAVRRALTAAPRRGVTARGLGRSYGDLAQNGGGTVLDMTGLDRILDFDTSRGTVRVEAGASLDRLLRHVAAAAWWLPVLPGTRQVTVGGAIACDVHGKNHHARGSFGDHVLALDLIPPEGDLVTVTPDGDAADLFWATIGGLGLTGVIVAATLCLDRIETTSFSVTTSREPDLDSMTSALRAADHTAPYTVGWFDTAARGARRGRGIVMAGSHAARGDLSREAPTGYLDLPASETARVPVTSPSSLVRPTTARVFNELWYTRAPRHRTGEIQDATTFLHPLDAVADWNRIYGRRGFCQYQCVVPASAAEALTALVHRISVSGHVSALTVLKRFGRANRAPLSFPMPGWTLAVDFPVRRGLHALLTDLDALVLQAGGRLYLAKDSRMRAAHLPAMYPRIEEFRAIRDRVDPRRCLTSDLSRRLEL